MLSDFQKGLEIFIKENGLTKEAAQTIANVVEQVDPNKFTPAFTEWMAKQATPSKDNVIPYRHPGINPEVDFKNNLKSDSQLAESPAEIRPDGEPKDAPIPEAASDPDKSKNQPDPVVATKKPGIMDNLTLNNTLMPGAIGGVGGAATGALLGNLMQDKDDEQNHTLRNALLGGGLGALGGAAYGAFNPATPATPQPQVQAPVPPADNLAANPAANPNAGMVTTASLKATNKALHNTLYKFASQKPLLSK